MSFNEDNQAKQDFKNAVAGFGGKEKVLNNLDVFKSELLKIKNAQSKNTFHQIFIILELSNVFNYLDNDSISSIDINNCIINIENTCGFSRGKAQELLSIILYAFDYGDLTPETVLTAPVGTKRISSKYASQNHPSGQVYGLDNYNNDLYQLQRIIDAAVYKNNASDAGEYTISDNQQSIIQDKSELLGFLCSQGHPKALLIKGELYLYGMATEKNSKKAYEYLARAANAGSSKANTLLGDYYYRNSLSYTKAYSHYSDIGAVASLPQQKDNLAAIINNKKYHLIWFCFSILVFVVSIIFSVLLLSGAFCPSGCKHYVTGIILMVLSAGLFGLSVFSFIKEKYDSRKIFFFVTCILMCICSFFAIVL